MNYKKNGFTYVECVISLAIMMIGVMLIYSSLSGGINLVNKNSDYRKMVNKAKYILDDKKHEVANNTTQEVNNYYNVEENGDYTVHTKVEEVGEYYQCYKIDVKITTNNKDLELTTYVTKQ